MAFSYGGHWEMFYTDSQLDNEDLVDQISIDTANKRYILDIDAIDMVTDGYDENNEPIYSTYVSRTVFDIIVEGIKRQNYVRYVSENNKDENN